MEKSKQTNILSAIISLAPALIQIFAFFAVELSDRLNLKTILLNSENLILVNILSLISSVVVISAYSFWKSKSFILNMKTKKLNQNSNDLNKQQNKEEPPYLPDKTSFRMLIIGIIITVISCLLLVIITSIRKAIPSEFINYLIPTQWIIYIILLASFSFNIYIWLEDKDKQSHYEEERTNFIPLALEKMRESGWLDQIKLHYFDQIGNSKFLVIELNDKFFLVRTSFDGKQINNVQKFDSIDKAMNLLFPPSVNVQK